MVLHIPSREPCASGVVESVGGAWVGVNIGLAAGTIREEPVGSTDGNVKDKIELLVERSVVRLVLPWVKEFVSETSLAPEGLRGGINIENNVVRGIDVGLDTVFSPVEAISVHSIGERGVMEIVLMSHVVGIFLPVRSPMESGAKTIVTTGGATCSIGSARFNNIDLSRHGPGAIRIVLGEHPDSRPDHITSRKLSYNLNTAILESKALSSAETGAHDGVDVVSTGSSVALTAPEGVGSAKICWCSSPDGIISCHHGLFTDGVGCQSGLEVKNAVVDKGVLTMVLINFKLPVSTTRHGNFMLPL